MGQTVVTGPDGKKYRVTHPDGASNDEIYRQLQTNLGQTAPRDYTADVVDAARGFGKGLAAPIVGAGQIAEHLFPGTAAGVRSIPGVSSAAHAAKEFVMSPDQTWGESIGDFTGAAAPFVAGELATGGAATPAAAARIATAFGRPALRTGASTLGEIAKSMLWGGASAGAQPTESGTLGSHAEHAAEGVATALPFGVAGRAISKLTPEVAGKVARHVATHGQAGVVGTGMHAAGIPWWMGVSPWFLWNQLHHSPLSDLAARAGKASLPAAQAVSRGVEKTAPAAVGTGVGQAQEQDDGE